MKKQKKPQVSLVLSVIALLLAAYATFNIINVQAVQNDDDFKSKIFKLIDDYIAEKSGQPTGPVDVSIDDDAVMGSENAPVTIVEFSDFQCPFCKRFATETFPQIAADYIETGKVRFVFRDFPLGNHPNAAPAANAAECIREQGGDAMYIKYHDDLFANQEELSVEKYKELASHYDIDQAQFASCVDENKFADEVQADFNDGAQYGVRGTPAFFINGNLFAGAQPYENFKAAIEQVLAE